MGNNDRRPKIRFKGFNDDWEQHKLGNLGYTYTGLSGKTKNDFGHGDGKFITYINVFSNTIADCNLVESVEIDKKQNKVEYGDILFTTSSETPKEVGMSSVYLGNEDNIYLNSFCFGFKPTYKFDNYYIAYILRSVYVRKKIIPLAQGISRYNISKSKMMEIQINLPCMIEQKKIGEFFKQLDNDITLHQRKLEKLGNIKKSMLEKMFPKDENKVPEIRFKGFNDDWEQHKFENVFNYLQNNSLSRAELSEDEGKLMNIHYGDILIKFGEIININNDFLPFIKKENLLKKYKSSLLDNGDIVIADAAEDLSVGKCSEIIGISSEKILAGLHTIPCRPKLKFAPRYLGYYMNSDSYHNQLLPIIQGTKVSSISKTSIKNTLIKCPIKTEEQNKIGKLFNKIDSLIVLHQRKLEKLKNIKKACLEKMFV